MGSKLSTEKIERGRQGSLRWLPFYGGNNNQIKVGIRVGRGVGEETRLGRIVWGGGLSTTTTKHKLKYIDTTEQNN
jgi:hypothetical protein